MDTTPGYTSLAAMLHAAGFDNSTGLVEDWYDLRVPIESLLATVFAEAMSRVGLENNTQSIIWSDDAVDQLVSDGSAILPYPDTANLTELRWNVAVSGYAYSADGVAYYLAFIVLFTHVAIALVHTIYTVRKRATAIAWGTAEELLVLSQNSAPAPAALSNTCAGIEHHPTMQRVMKIRALVGHDAAVRGERVHLVVEGDVVEEDYEEVRPGESYGAIP
jgi:hypothetical protein